MRHALTSVLSGLGLSIFAAVIVIAAVGSSFVASGLEASIFERFLTTFLRVAAFALVPALAAIGLAEARRVQGLIYWLAVGTTIASLGFLSLWIGSGTVLTAGAMVVIAADFLAAGIIAGWVYWYRVGKRSGGIAIALARAAETPLGPELAAHRCRRCTAVVLLLAVVPFFTVGWGAICGGVSGLSSRLVGQGTRDARTRLDNAGLHYLSVSFDDGAAVVNGTVPRGVDANAAFAKANDVLAPMIGFPGIAPRLSNAVSADNAKAAAP